MIKREKYLNDECTPVSRYKTVSLQRMGVQAEREGIQEEGLGGR